MDSQNRNQNKNSNQNQNKTSNQNSNKSSQNSNQNNSQNSNQNNNCKQKAAFRGSDFTSAACGFEYEDRFHFCRREDLSKGFCGKICRSRQDNIVCICFGKNFI